MFSWRAPSMRIEMAWCSRPAIRPLQIAPTMYAYGDEWGALSLRLRRTTAGRHYTALHQSPQLGSFEPARRPLARQRGLLKDVTTPHRPVSAQSRRGWIEGWRLNLEVPPTRFEFSPRRESGCRIRSPALGKGGPGACKHKAARLVYDRGCGVAPDLLTGR